MLKSIVLQCSAEEDSAADLMERIILQTWKEYYCKLKSKDRIVLRLKREDSSADMQESLVVLQIYIREAGRH